MNSPAFRRDLAGLSFWETPVVDINAPVTNGDLSRRVKQAELPQRSIGPTEPDVPAFVNEPQRCPEHCNERWLDDAGVVQ